MSLILVPKEGEDIRVKGWNWRPTLELLFAAGVITEEDHEVMGCQTFARAGASEGRSLTLSNDGGSRRSTRSQRMRRRPSGAVRLSRLWIVRLLCTP